MGICDEETSEEQNSSEKLAAYQFTSRLRSGDHSLFIPQRLYLYIRNALTTLLFQSNLYDERIQQVKLPCGFICM